MTRSFLRHSVPVVGAALAAAGVIATLGVLASGLISRSSAHRTTTGVEPPPPSTVMTVPEPSTRREAVLGEADRVVRGLPEASIVFTVPETVRLGRSTRIQLLLSAQEPIRELKKRLTELGKREGARIKVSDRMQAHLSGLGFKIEALRPEVQAVSNLIPTEWEWDIEATKPGTHHLTLTVSALIRLQGESTPLPVQTFEKTLTIRVTLYERVSRFVSRNWQWLWVAIGVPLVTSLYAAYKRARRTHKPRSSKTSTLPPSPQKPAKQKTVKGDSSPPS